MKSKISNVLFLCVIASTIITCSGFALIPIGKLSVETGLTVGAIGSIFLYSSIQFFCLKVDMDAEKELMANRRRKVRHRVRGR